MSRSGWTVLGVSVVVLSAAAAAQQPPPIGIAPVTLAAGPYVFDTAEQHKIAVSVVARGLLHAPLECFEKAYQAYCQKYNVTAQELADSL